MPLKTSTNIEWYPISRP